MNPKKFWQRGGVSKMLEKPGKAFEKTFRVVRGRKSEFEELGRVLPDSFPALEKGMKILDRGFPIREGASRIDYLLINPAKELTFVWTQKRSCADTLSKLLPDYHWIQKNSAIWPHLFPELLENKALQMRVWIFALEIDKDLDVLLTYLQGVRIQIFHARCDGAHWRFQAWEASRSVPPPVLPSSPSLLTVVDPPLRKPEPRPRQPLLTQDELNDLLGVGPGGEKWHEEETTDPHYPLDRIGD